MSWPEVVHVCPAACWAPMDLCGGDGKQDLADLWHRKAVPQSAPSHLEKVAGLLMLWSMCTHTRAHT